MVWRETQAQNIALLLHKNAARAQDMLKLLPCLMCRFDWKARRTYEYSTGFNEFAAAWGILLLYSPIVPCPNTIRLFHQRTRLRRIGPERFRSQSVCPP